MGKIARELSFQLSLFAMMIACMVALWQHQLTLTFVLIGLFLLGRKIMHSHRHDWSIFVSSILISFMIEIVSVYFGAWTYSAPNLFNIPSYIPIAYGTGTVIVFNISQTLNNKLAAIRNNHSVFDVE